MGLLPTKSSRRFAEGGQMDYNMGGYRPLGSSGTGAAQVAGNALAQNLPPLAVPYIHVRRADLDGIRSAAAAQSQEQAGELTKKLTDDFAKITEKKTLPAQAAIITKAFSGILNDVQTKLTQDPAHFNNPANRAAFITRYQNEVGGADVQKAVASRELVDKVYTHHLDRKDLLGQNMSLNGERLSITKGNYLINLQTEAGGRTRGYLGMSANNPLGSLNLPTVDGNASDAETWTNQMAGLAKPSENGYNREQLNGLQAKFDEQKDAEGQSLGQQLSDVWYATKTGTGSRTTSNARSIALLQYIARNAARYAPPSVLNALREQGAQTVDNMSLGTLLNLTTAPRDKQGKATGPATTLAFNGQALPTTLGVNQLRGQLEDLLDEEGLPPAKRAEVLEVRHRLNQLAGQQAEAEMANNLSMTWNLGRIESTVTSNTVDVGRGMKKEDGAGGSGDGSQADFEQRFTVGDPSIDFENMSITSPDKKTVKTVLGTMAPAVITDEYSKSVIKPDGQHKTMAQFMGGGNTNSRVFDAKTLDLLNGENDKHLNLGATHLLEATGKLMLVPVAGQESVMINGSQTQIKSQVTTQVNGLVKQGDFTGAVKVALNAGYKVVAGYNASADIKTWDDAGLKSKSSTGNKAVGPNDSDYRSLNLLGFNKDVEGAWLTGVNKVELNTAFGLRPVTDKEREMLPDTNGFDDYYVKEVMIEMSNFGFTNRGATANKWAEKGNAKVQAIRTRQNNDRTAATAPLVPPKLTK